MKRPAPLNGMRHIALQAQDLEASERFYVELLGMDVLRRAHDDLVYLTLGNDNLSLSRAKSPVGEAPQRLDHFGFVVDIPEDVDAWHDYLKAQGVEVTSAPHDHPDGARSFYCLDPDGNSVQPLYHPCVSGQCLAKTD